jgi:hypothetical protein
MSKKDKRIEYLQHALSVIEGEAHFLKLAIESKDPKREILLRVKDIEARAKAAGKTP